MGDASIAEDPLRRWFTEDTAVLLPFIEQRIAMLLDPHVAERWLAPVDCVSELSSATSHAWLSKSDG